VRYGHIHDPTNGTTIDEVLVTFMQAPHTFTREDVVEISCHGGTLPVQRTLHLVLQAGARLADAGEFTMRAFLNGRIDLTQAEATLDVIQAQTETALALAHEQLGGWLAHEVRRIRATLLDVLAYVTALIDFPEDEVEPQTILPSLHASTQSIAHMLATANQGMIYRQGIRAVLVGRPNVGKSSLLNALLRSNRAIVTPIPGTTRDTLEETANLHGIPVVLVDTAGMTDSDDPVERLGVERSRAALATADLALLVFDSQYPLGDDDKRIAQLTIGKPTLVVWNKADLTGETLPTCALPFEHPHILGQVAASTLTSDGTDALVAQLGERLVGRDAIAAGGAHLITNPRHRATLDRAAQHIAHALASYEQQVPIDFLATDLTAAIDALGEITGETVTEDLLHTIFSRFCIGK
jgi:tRNA modification GTPase